MPASGMADNLPADLVVLYQDAFAHFDTENTGIISTKSLGPLLRYCGENPSEAEVQVKLFPLSKVHQNKVKISKYFFVLMGRDAARHGSVPHSAERWRATPSPIQNKNNLITHGKFCRRKSPNETLVICKHCVPN